MWLEKNKLAVNIAVRVFAIIAVCTLIVFSLPKVGTFQYEYQVGFPWRYETLNAPFDFPIYKTESELEENKKQAEQNHTAIFNLSTETAQTQIEKISERVALILTDTASNAYKKLINGVRASYETGIIELPENMRDNPPALIKVVEKNVGQNVEPGSYITAREAYARLSADIKSLHVADNIKKQLADAGLNSLLAANIEYDEQKTQKDLERIRENISITEGMVKRGEIIVAKRETVTPEKTRLLESLKRTYKEDAWSSYNRERIIFGQILLVLITITIYSIFFFYSKRELLNNNKGFFLLYAALLGMVLSGAVAYHEDINFYSLPVLFFVIIVNILAGSRSALYLLISGTLILSCFAPNSAEYSFMQLTAGVVGIFTLSSMQRRGQLFLSILLIFLTYSIGYAAFSFMKSGEFQVSQLNTLFWLMINCLQLSLTYPVLYLFEKIFGYTSEITLIELANPHHPALRALTKKAPGTFQHSLIVANMAEEAVDRIGGNVLLTRTGALYHDIGKSENPFLFIENQSGGKNPHDAMECDESAKKIIAHVSKGVEIARKHHLPDVIIQFIKTHHGRSKVKYFYNSFRNKYPDAEVDEAVFTYKGPDPVSKECSVVMMADAVEAVVRTLKEKGEDSISETINQIIDSQIAEGRFNHSELSFNDVTVIKAAFLEVLASTYHSRVAYPKLKIEKT